MTPRTTGTQTAIVLWALALAVLLPTSFLPLPIRIDAHSLAEEGVTRLCYAGSTLHTRPMTSSRLRSMPADRSSLMRRQLWPRSSLRKIFWQA